MKLLKKDGEQNMLNLKLLRDACIVEQASITAKQIQLRSDINVADLTLKNLAQKPQSEETNAKIVLLKIKKERDSKQLPRLGIIKNDFDYINSLIALSIDKKVPIDFQDLIAKASNSQDIQDFLKRMQLKNPIFISKHYFKKAKSIAKKNKLEKYDNQLSKRFNETKFKLGLRKVGRITQYTLAGGLSASLIALAISHGIKRNSPEPTAAPPIEETTIEHVEKLDSEKTYSELLSECSGNYDEILEKVFYPLYVKAYNNTNSNQISVDQIELENNINEKGEIFSAMHRDGQKNIDFYANKEFLKNHPNYNNNVGTLNNNVHILQDMENILRALNSIKLYNSTIKGSQLDVAISDYLEKHPEYENNFDIKSANSSKTLFTEIEI